MFLVLFIGYTPFTFHNQYLTLSFWFTDVEPGSPDGTQNALHVCPFCHQSYQHSTYLREHIKVCQEREGGQNVCPLCGYCTPYRAQMERHMALHVQVKEKVRVLLQDVVLLRPCRAKPTVDEF